MSHEKIKSISINEKKSEVYITSASSNCFPQTYERYKCKYLEKMLIEQGRDAVDNYILEQYQGGMMQGGNNEYRQTMQLFNNATPEGLNQLRKLKKDTKGNQYIIQHGNTYFSKITKKRAICTRYKEEALKLNKIDAMIKAKKFTDVQIIKIKEQNFRKQ